MLIVFIQELKKKGFIKSLGYLLGEDVKNVMMHITSTSSEPHSVMFSESL